MLMYFAECNSQAMLLCIRLQCTVKQIIYKYMKVFGQALLPRTGGW